MNNIIKDNWNIIEEKVIKPMYEDGSLPLTVADEITKALEKQKSKKPIDSYNWEDLSEEERLETPRWYCKSCDGVIEEHYSYCALCSQAIDWSD